MTVTLYQGDCLEVMATLPDQSVDAVLCDPPYGTTACKWDAVIPFAPMWEQLRRITKPRGAIVLFGSQPFTSALVMSNPKMYRYVWYWQKERGTGFQFAKHQPLRQIEECVIFGYAGHVYNAQKTPCKPYTGTLPIVRSAVNTFSLKHSVTADGARIRKVYTERTPTNVLAFARDSAKVHPTQKPVALMEYLTRTYTDEGDTVLDFTFGSGTTGVACLNTGRSFIGIERDPHYFSIARERIAAATPTE